MAHPSAPGSGHFPETPVGRWLAPMKRFMHIEASSGLVLMACTIAALLLANSPWSASFLALWDTPCTIGFGEWKLQKSLLLVINDGFMAVFFFVVGLEIKREIVAGELSSPRKAALPIVAALGGMALPALIYLGLSGPLELPEEALQGWAVPMATDIAFVVGIMALFGKRIPFGLKIMILSLAIVDDLGAVLVIALVFTETIAWSMLGLAAAGLAITWMLNRIGVRRVPVYVLVGAVVWLAVLKSGVHPTVAGVVLGLMTPASAWIGDRALLSVLDDLVMRLRGRDSAGSTGKAELQAALESASLASRESVSPLARLEHALHPWVAFFVMPVFALANAGVPIRIADAGDPVAVAIAAGLALGKPLGIVIFSFLAVKAGLAALPTGVGWKMLTGGGCLAGIGFTMAIFLATLSLPEASLGAGKIGILLGSLVSAVAGSILLAMSVRKAEPSDQPLHPA